jgi:hypothetical protein
MGSQKIFMTGVLAIAAWLAGGDPLSAPHREA